MLSEQKLKNLVNIKAKELGIAPQQIYGLYGLEQLLIKLSQSPYKEYFVLKGGYLLSATYGLDVRATRDLDTTVRGLPLTEQKITEICQFIERPLTNENFIFKIRKISSIRSHFDYQGYNIKLYFQLGSGRFPIEIDITTGEELLPIQRKENIPLIFSGKTLSFYSYPLEQVLADKLYTTLAYGAVDDTNSRMKDLYDIYFLTKFNTKINYSWVNQAIEKTKEQREVQITPAEYLTIVEMLRDSSFQQEEWHKYQAANIYAKEASFKAVMDALERFTEKVKKANF